MNKIDKIIDDLSYCSATGGWDKHYIETVEECRKELQGMIKRRDNKIKRLKNTLRKIKTMINEDYDHGGIISYVNDNI